MNHREIQDRLDAYFDLQLPAVQRREVEAHIAGCPACATALERQRQVSRAVFRRVPVPSTDIFVTRVMARIREAAEEPVSVFAGFWKWPALALAALATALIITAPRGSVPAVDQVCSTRNVLLADSAGRLISAGTSAPEAMDTMLDVTEEI